MNFWARLLDGDRAHKLLENLLAFRTSKNLFCLHPPFQIDGNFVAAAGMSEMLLQSHTGIIHLLPALPSSWVNGEIKGIKARGALEVAIKWEEGTLVSATIKSLKGGTYKVKYKEKEIEITAEPGDVVILDNQLKF